MAEPTAWTRWRGALPPLAWAATLALLSHQPALPDVAPPIPHADKLVHAGAYALLAALLGRWRRAAGDLPGRALLVAAAAASLYGVSDELHQAFVPGRDPDVGDWIADTLGGLLGAAWAVGLPGRKSRASIRG